MTEGPLASCTTCPIPPQPGQPQPLRCPRCPYVGMIRIREQRDDGLWETWYVKDARVTENGDAP